MAKPNPTIVVPGITASYLRDYYPVSPETIWAVLHKDYERAVLHPDNLDYEAREPARILPDQVYEIAYRELIEELRHNLRRAEDDTVPVYPFPYDWRLPLEAIEEQFAEFVEEVIDRTKLMRNYHPDYAADPKVNLVGHSMGGLVIAGYVDAYGTRGRIDKVVSLASPFRGSFEAVIKVTTGTANLGTEPPGSREREAARLTPALYHLMPSFRHGLVVDGGLPNSLFDPGLWQPSIVDTIGEFIRLHGVDPGKSKGQIRQQAAALFADLLEEAKKHRRRLDRLDLAHAGLSARDWLCVLGVHATTRVRLHVRNVAGKPDFAFHTKDRDDSWETGDTPETRRLTGDGTVPFEGALPRFLPYESLVCVTPDDYGYWEIADKAATRFGGFHGILPNMNMLHRLIVRHLTGRPDRHGNTWGRLPPGVGKADWDPPVPNLTPKG